MMSNISPHSLLSGFEYLLRQARLHLREGRLDEAEQMLSEAAQEEPSHPNVLILRDALGGARLAQEEAHSAQKSKIHLLERELRFVMALMALLFFTGVWGFWRGAVSGASQGAAGGLPATVGVPAQGQHHHHGPSFRSKPRPQTRFPVVRRVLLVRSKPKPIRRTVLSKVKIHHKVATLRLHKKRRRRRRLSFSRALNRVQHRRVRRTHRKLARTHRKSKRHLRKRRVPRRRRIRFGDPALPSEIPHQWCGAKLRYGPYYPCLKRGKNRRCSKRATRQKYGCLRKRRRR